MCICCHLPLHGKKAGICEHRTGIGIVSVGFSGSCEISIEMLKLWKKIYPIGSINHQDMVLLHHEIEVDFPDSKNTEKHTATLVEIGKSNGKMRTAMALTVGIPAAIGALVHIAITHFPRKCFELN